MMIVAGVIWLAHIGVVSVFHGAGRGPLLSDVVQVTLGAMLIYSIVQASERSEGMAISFWRAVARASRRLATLLQAMRSSMATAAARVYTTVRKSRTTPSTVLTAEVVNCLGYWSG